MLLTAVLGGLLVAGILYRFVVRAYLPVAATDLDAFAALYKAPETPNARRLYGAYLSRARRYRSTCSVVGWGASFFLAWQIGQVNVGIGPGLHPIYADLLVMGFGGYLLGAIAAELHHLRGRATGVRTASLAPRDPSAYVPSRQQVRLRVIAAASAIATVGYLVLHFVHYRAEKLSISVLGYGALALAVWVVIESAERAVVGRARPALPDDLARGDDAIRAAAAQTLATGGAGFVLLFTSWSAFYAANDVNTGINGTWDSVYAFVAFGSFIWAVRLAFRTRRLAWPSRKIVVEGVPA